MDSLTHIYKDTQEKQLSEIEQYAPYASNDRSVFYAGYSAGNWARAEEYAAQHEMVRVNDTRAGLILDSITDQGQIVALRDDSNDPDSGNRRSETVWNANSAAYARAAQGEARTFVCGANADSTFRRVELPELLANEKVVSLNGLDRAELSAFREQTLARNVDQGRPPEDAVRIADSTTFRRVAIAELRQDLATARAGSDQVATEDANARLAALVTQHKQELAASMQAAQAEQRREEIFQRTYDGANQRAQAQGTEVSPEDLAVTANRRVERVEEKFDLNAQRAELQSGDVPVKTADARAYIERELDFRDRRAADFAARSELLGQPGLQLDRERGASRDLEVERRTDEFVARARLDQNARAGVIPADEVQERREQLEASLRSWRDEDAHQSLREDGSRAERGETVEPGAATHEETAAQSTGGAAQR